VANPRVVEAILASAQRYKADPVALLATALQESGARYNAVGDQGTSFGPFQYHRGGALGTHTPQWAMSNAEIDAEAQRFGQYQIHGGKGAAALQRPADPVGYASAVQAKLAQARQILAQQGASGAPPMIPPVSLSTPHAPSASLTGGVGASGANRNALLQSIINANAELAGIPAITLPTISAPVVTQPEPITRDAAEPTPTATRPAPRVAANSIYQHANFAGHDQGVDYRGTGSVPALADAVVTRVQANSGWPGAGGKGTGSIVVYKVTSGPYRGRHVYVAENITPRVKVGQRVSAGQPIAIAHGAYPYTESGWADANGRAIGTLGTSNVGRDFTKAWGLT
jgi:hypothetical protein